MRLFFFSLTFFFDYCFYYPQRTLCDNHTETSTRVPLRPQKEIKEMKNVSPRCLARQSLAAATTRRNKRGFLVSRTSLENRKKKEKKRLQPHAPPSFILPAESNTFFSACLFCSVNVRQFANLFSLPYFYCSTQFLPLQRHRQAPGALDWITQLAAPCC